MDYAYLKFRSPKVSFAKSFQVGFAFRGISLQETEADWLRVICYITLCECNFILIFQLIQLLRYTVV